MDKKYAIFDMDGTLVDSMPYWRGLADEYLAQKGVKEIPPNTMDRIKHRHMTEAAAILVDLFGLNCAPETVMHEMTEVMRVHYARDVQVKEGIVEYLEALKAKGVRMCVATATAIPLVEVCLERLDLRKYFEGLFSCQTIRINKEHPDIYDTAARFMGAEREDCAVYEDAFMAVRTAKEAGYYVAGIYDYTGRAQWEDVQNTADELITDWRKAAEEL